MVSSGFFFQNVYWFLKKDWSNKKTRISHLWPEALVVFPGSSNL